MLLKEIADFDSYELKQSVEIYKSSFPTNETRPADKVVEMLENDKNYHLFISLSNNSVIGISLMYIFTFLGIGFLDYMAVIPNYQRKGIGNELFNFTLERFSSNISNNGIGLLMEIQRENVPDLRESITRKNRIEFYLRVGAKILDGVNYLLPPLQHGFEAEEMYLMIRPLVEIPYLTKESVVQYVNALYSTIYQYENDDMLEKISQKLPSRIMLRDALM
jgi:GNAT superfamily N-acetyltransferase